MILFMLIGNAYAWLDYPGNYCLQFDGVDDYIGFSGVVAQNFAIEFWVRPSHTIEAGSDSVYGHETGFLISIGTTILGYFNYRTGDLHLDLYVYAAYSGYPKYVSYACSRHIWEPSWYHIAIVHDGSTLTCYVNATIDLVATITQDLGHGYALRYYSTAGRIGTAINDTSLAYGGMIDEIRYWNVPRSAAEITQEYNRLLNQTEMDSPSLVGYWRLDDDLGATSCLDYSRQHINATLGGSPYSPSWQTVPEFPSFLILSSFMALSLLAVIIYKRKRTT